MANITADVEQLLAELVQITAKIAALVNTTGTDTSDDSDSLASTTNRLALSATIIAVAAFLIAALQAILEYTNSGESARRKCSSAAIGVFSKHVYKRWSFRHWRHKFYYPALDTMLHTDRYHVKHDISIWAPGLSIKKRDFWNRFRWGPYLQYRPRATWAQLLSPYHDNKIVDTTTRTYIDVDSIPGSLDVPPQMLDLVRLGTLLICIGFESVRINVGKRDFQALAKFGSITTEELTGFGKVVRFQKYDAKWRPQIVSPSSKWNRAALRLIRGWFNISAYDLKEKDLSCISSAQWDGMMTGQESMKNEADRMVSSLNKTIKEKGRNTWLDDMYEDVKAISDEGIQATFAQWQTSSALASNNMKCPSILVTLAVAGLPCARAGFPARMFLIPFLCQCRQICQTVLKRCEGALIELPSRVDYIDQLDPDTLPILEEDTLCFSRLAYLGLSHWAFKKTESLEESDGWQKTIQPYLKLMGEGEPQETEREDGTFQQWRVVLPPVIRLIKDFDPRFWAQSLDEEEFQVRSNIDFDEYNSPPLWMKTQIILLDISIQHHLDAGWKAYAPEIQFAGTTGTYSDRLFNPNTFISRVMTAIFKSVTERADVGSEPFQNLDEVLLSELITDKAITTENREHISQIAELLRLRVVLYAAYLMLIPDSSDIVETRLSVGYGGSGYGGFVLPMI